MNWFCRGHSEDFVFNGSYRIIVVYGFTTSVKVNGILIKKANKLNFRLIPDVEH